jgi:4-hydroxybutyryl-CoA dehydratase/vinylacetyl-CoA-Delta-isomerase
VLVGAVALESDYMGTAQASHVRDKLAEMIHLTETIYCGSVACSAMGHKTKAGNWEPNTLLANTTKYNVSKNIYEVARLAHDLAGGIIATLPFEDDLKCPETRKYVEKYLKGVSDISPEDRIRILRLIENMTGGTALVESMHGAGSPQAQKVMYMRAGNLEQKKKLAKKLAKISDKR